MLITSTKLTKPTNSSSYRTPSLSTYSTASSSSSSNTDTIPNVINSQKPLNNLINMRKSISNNTNQSGTSSKFEFKPLLAQKPPLDTSNNKARLSLSSKNSSMRNENQVNSWLHSMVGGKDGTNGKITKAFKADTNKIKSLKKLNKEQLLNNEVLESFNLPERERYRLLISQNLTKKTQIGSPMTSLNSSQNRNLYQKYIRTSPTQIRDDNNICHHQSHVDGSSIQLVSYAPNLGISRNYTRRISLSSETVCNHVEVINGNIKAPVGSLFNIINASNNINNKTRSTGNVTVIELDNSQNQSPSSVVKVAKKRPTSAHSNYYDENNDNPIENLKQETRQFYDKLHIPPISNNNNRKSGFVYNLMANTNFLFNEKGKKWSEKLNEVNNVQEMIKMTSTNLSKDEERFMYKKRQRMEKERIEKELAEKFSLQLHLESNKLNIFEQEDVEIDEFPEFTDEQEECIRNALIPNPQGEVLASGFALEITRKDIQTLKGLNWLNDEVINFYMNLIMERSNTANSDNNNNGNNYDSKTKVYAFSTFFYPKLVKDGYSSLRRWTKKIDLFTYNLVIIPIHLGMHWTLAVIDFDCKEIKYYDSMNGNNSECLKALRNYLKEEYADKKSGAQYDISSWNCLHVKDVPQQMNGSDCGMFACKYADFISRGKAICFNQSHMAYYRRRMVWEIVNKRMIQ